MSDSASSRISREISVEELFKKRDDRIHVITVERTAGKITGLNLTNKKAFLKTIETHTCYYYDPVNDTEYLKGEHSGEIETIISIRLDCCHARRHFLHLLYVVDMQEGKCKFGVLDCHFYRFKNGRFVFDDSCVKNKESVYLYRNRIETLLDTSAEILHQKRFKK